MRTTLSVPQRIIYVKLLSLPQVSERTRSACLVRSDMRQPILVHTGTRHTYKWVPYQYKSEPISEIILTTRNRHHNTQRITPQLDYHIIIALKRVTAERVTLYSRIPPPGKHHPGHHRAFCGGGWRPHGGRN